MTRLFAIIAISVCCLNATPANAQIGAHKKISTSADAKSRFKKKAVEQENDPTHANYKQNTEVSGFKVSVGEESTTSIEFIVSDNAKACELQAFNPRPTDINYCKAALAEPGLSNANRFSVIHNMGLMQMAYGENDIATQTLLSAAELLPENPASYLSLMQLEMDRGNNTAAMEYANLALSKDPKPSAKIHLILGYLYERDFQFDKARNSYKAAVASNSGYGEAKRRLERANRLWPAE